MVSQEFKDYVAERSAIVHICGSNLCDICSKRPDAWAYGAPYLCETHARELDVLW